MRWARRLGNLAYALSAHLRRVGLANLDLAYGPRLDGEEKKRILRRSFQNSVLVALDLFWFGRDTRKRLSDWVVFDEAANATFGASHAQVIITGHLGNWEVYGQAVAARGHPLMSVASPLANATVDRLLVRQREQSGQIIVPRVGAVLKLLRHLKRGGQTALLLDQNTKPSEGGIFVNFFGLPVPVATAAAALAARTGAGLSFGYCLPDDEGRYHATISAVLPTSSFPAGEPASVAAALTSRLTVMAEDAVRSHPEFWAWTYKRWKHVPPWMPREVYPFYAKPLSASELRHLPAPDGTVGQSQP